MKFLQFSAAALYISVAFSGTVSAAPCPSSALTPLVNGTTANATAVMDNFNSILNCINTGINSTSYVSGQNTGINVPTPLSTLDVGGNLTIRGDITATSSASAYTIAVSPNLSDSYVQLWGSSTQLSSSLLLGTSGQTRLTIIPNGSVGIGNSQPTYTLHVNGSVAGSAPYVNTSDGRFKKNVQPIPYGLNTVMKLRPVEFEWKDQTQEWQKQPQLGLIAQEVEHVVPEVVSIAKDGIETRSIAYSEIIPILIKSIQDLNGEMTNIRNEKAQLEARISKMEQASNMDPSGKRASLPTPTLVVGATAVAGSN